MIQQSRSDLFMYNQRTMHSYDHHIWVNRRGALYRLMQEFCIANSISYFPHIAVLNEGIERIANSKHSKIIISNIFEPMQYYERWVTLNQILKDSGKICFVVTDNYLEFEELEFVKFFSYPELLGITASYSDIDLQPTEPSKLYNCFIQRVDSVRLSWFYFLCDRNLLDKGYVSCLMKQMRNYSNGLTGKELLDYMHYHYQLDQLPTFDKAYKSIRDQIPYQNFKEEKNLIPLILDSKYSLVLETDATSDGNGSWHFTEKSLRTLQLPSIPLLFVPAKGIGILKSLGLEFGDHLNYLDNLTWHQRQIELVDFLVKDEVEFNWKELYNQCRHNRDLLESWRFKYEQPDFFDEFFTKVLAY